MGHVAVAGGDARIAPGCAADTARCSTSGQSPITLAA